MRRSCAPSMLKTANCKKDTENEPFESTNSYVHEIENWGTKGNVQNGSNTYFKSFKNKKVYNVLWREVSMRKNKTWKGDGTVEFDVDNKQAVLKDDTGKYMGNITMFKILELHEGLQMVINGKEIELQDEIKDANEYLLVRKRQISNRWGDEEYQSEETKEKKPKGSFVFRPNLLLTTPKNSKMTNIKSADKYSRTTHIKSNKNQQYLNNQNHTNLTKSHEIFQHKRNETQNLKSVNRLMSSENTTNSNPTLPKFVSKSLKEMSPKTQDATISPKLLKNLRPHQRIGVNFIYACLMGFQQPNYYGCILADEMGLGKTLQVLAAAHTMLRKQNPDGKCIANRVLIVTPSSLTSNWNNEVNKWLNIERIYAFVVDGKHKISSYLPQKHIPFVIASYDALLSQIDEFLNIKFDIFICDEGHRLKNQTTKIYITLYELNIKRRIILTGTPVQNNLQEFFCLADFVNPGIFGSRQHFRQHFEIPLEQSQFPEVREEIKQLAIQRSTELNECSMKFLLRRSQQENIQYLPKKREYICFVRPTDLQMLLLQKAVDLYKSQQDTILKDLNPLQIITILKKICNHPSLIAHSKSPNILTRYLERYLPDWSEMGPFHSAKLDLLQQFLTTSAVDMQEKCVIVSNHTKTLNMIQGLCDYLNIICLRLDGSTPLSERNRNVKEFNSNTTGADTALVFLLSAKAGGVGLNLIGASRLILFDNDWNPATDAQAMSRIWRDGQSKDVQIYRLITAGTIEEKIFQRQMTKISLGDCIMQSNEIVRDSIKFSNEELLDLFTLQANVITCQTHELLKCNCTGNGKNLVEQNYVSNDKQINELMQWEHYKIPIDNTFLEEACLHNASENLLYIFSNQIDKQEISE